MMLVKVASGGVVEHGGHLNRRRFDLSFGLSRSDSSFISGFGVYSILLHVLIAELLNVWVQHRFRGFSGHLGLRGFHFELRAFL